MCVQVRAIEELPAAMPLVEAGMVAARMSWKGAGPGLQLPKVKVKVKGTRRHTPQSHPRKPPIACQRSPTAFLRWELAGEPERGSSQRKAAPLAAAILIPPRHTHPSERRQLRRANGRGPRTTNKSKAARPVLTHARTVSKPCGTGAVEGRQQNGGATPDSRKGGGSHRASRGRGASAAARGWYAC
jgi:hypothetical protein